MCAWRWRLLVRSHFCKCCKNALLIHSSDLPHHLSLIVWVCFESCHLFQLKLDESKLERRGRGHLVLLTGRSTKVLLQHSSTFVSHPSVHKGKQWNICVALFLSFQSLYVNIKKPYHSDTYAQPGINNIRCTPACFIFTKKNRYFQQSRSHGISCSSSKVCGTFFSNKLKRFLMLCHKSSKGCLRVTCVFLL